VKCPHCLMSFHEAWTVHTIGPEKKTGHIWKVGWLLCPECGRFVIRFSTLRQVGHMLKNEMEMLAYPKGKARPISSDVPEPFAGDFREASLVLLDSPKASAAISRRCLQHLLRERAGVKKSDLAKEIDEVLASNRLPGHLAEAIDAIRSIGNFAAHPLKSTNTGEVMDVEPGEADWLLDTLEGLYDFFVTVQGVCTFYTCTFYTDSLRSG
jgi:hypothetical protein